MNKYIIKFNYTSEIGKPIQYKKEIEATEDKLAIMEGIKEVTEQVILGKVFTDDAVEILTNLMMEIDESLTVNDDKWILSGKDNFTLPDVPIDPLVLQYRPEEFRFVNIRYVPGTKDKIKSYLQDAWKKFDEVHALHVMLVLPSFLQYHCQK